MLLRRRQRRPKRGRLGPQSGRLGLVVLLQLLQRQLLDAAAAVAAAGGIGSPICVALLGALAGLAARRLRARIGRAATGIPAACIGQKQKHRMFTRGAKERGAAKLGQDGHDGGGAVAPCPLLHALPALLRSSGLRAGPGTGIASDAAAAQQLWVGGADSNF